MQEAAGAVLALDPDNADARALLTAADRAQLQGQLTEVKLRGQQQ